MGKNRKRINIVRNYKRPNLRQISIKPFIFNGKRKKRLQTGTGTGKPQFIARKGFHRAISVMG